METMRDIQIRMKSIDSTRQITESMRLISNRKVQKIKKRMEDNRPYLSQSAAIVGNILANPQLSPDIKNHAYMTGRANKKEDGAEEKSKNPVIIVITGDRGLCGGYNSNVEKEASLLIKKLGDADIIAVGTKGRDYFRRRQRNIAKSYKGLSESPYYEDAQDIANTAIKMFDDGETDEVYLVYTEYKTMLVQTPRAVRLLPLDADGIAAIGSAGVKNTEVNDKKEEKPDKEPKIKAGENYDTEEIKFFEYAATTYMTASVFGSMLGSAVSEQCARMTGMDSAVKNSKKILDSLTLQYNQIRQSTITQEIAEIVGGANAVGEE